ncbi:MAG TPA: serine/threonine-protein kinase [Actinomycetes bacterium]|jgi:hypothetical protein|nr:serine/threonine-protein kinase [Actinomycetes bacterium]
MAGEDRLTHGMCLGQRYRLVDWLGQGGMASVWRAVDQVLGRLVAVKVLAPGLMADRAFLERFRVEARAAAQLSHPHITGVFDYGEWDVPSGERVAFIVMELLDGESLATRLQRGPLPWHEAVAVCAQVAQALAAAHRRGVVHRDVKPGNVVLTDAGAKVLDFGIAALAGQEALTSSGGVLGTAAYVAPELLAGELVTPAVDVYALGAVLFEALTGGPPPAAGAETAAMAAAQLHERLSSLASLPGLPPEILPLERRCLARQPAERPSSAEVAKRLRAALGFGSAYGTALRPAGASDTALLPPLGVAGPAAGTPPRPVRPSGRGRLVAAALVATAAAVAVAMVVATALRPAQRPHVARAGPSGTTAPPATTSTSSTTGPASVSTQPASQPLDALEQLRRGVEDGVASGDIRADVGRDLDHLIGELRKRLTEGRVGGLSRRVDGLRHKLDERVREGAISPARAQALSEAVSAFTQTLPER